jgi:hypothetical protein
LSGSNSVGRMPASTASPADTHFPERDPRAQAPNLTPRRRPPSVVRSRPNRGPISSSSKRTRANLNVRGSPQGDPHPALSGGAVGSLVRKADDVLSSSASLMDDHLIEEQARPFCAKGRSDRSANYPPNCPPTSVLLVLKLKFYTKIFALYSRR